MKLHTKIRFALAGLLLCAIAMPAAVQASECVSVSDNKTRAACLAQGRRSYGASLERTLSEIGTSANVFVEETGDPGSGAYPRLIVWTFLTKDKVHELIDEARILNEARKAGFRMIVFVDKGGDDRWYFDLTRAANAPLDVVPPYTPAWNR